MSSEIRLETEVHLPVLTFMGAPDSVFRRVLETTAALAETDAKKLQSGPVLNVVSGFLSSRTNARVTREADGWTIRLGNPQRYSRILELGGTTAPHIIRPRRPGGVLAFESGGQTIFARLVNHPGSRIAPHPTLRPALEGQVAKIPERMERAVDQATR